MKHGEYRLAKQQGKWGYFGEVALQVETNGGSGAIEVDFDANQAQEWQAGARFGIDYVLEHLPIRKLFPQGARIHVESINGHLVDTTNTVIAYAAANALLRALEIEMPEAKKPNFDAEKGLFVFPK